MLNNFYKVAAEIWKLQQKDYYAVGLIREVGLRVCLMKIQERLRGALRSMRSLGETTRRFIALGGMIIASFVIFSLWVKLASQEVGHLSLGAPPAVQKISAPPPEAEEYANRFLSPAAGIAEAFRSAGMVLRRAVTQSEGSPSTMQRVEDALASTRAWLAQTSENAGQFLQHVLQREVSP